MLLEAFFFNVNISLYLKNKIFDKNNDLTYIKTIYGEEQELLNPASVALLFIHSYYGHTKATLDSLEKVQTPPNGDFRF